jgi:hypothetical protein
MAPLEHARHQLWIPSPGSSIPVEIHESHLCDLSRLLISLYGVGYIGHPRLTRLIEKNQISNRDYLTGEEEARAFENKEYVRLHQSTLRKVDMLANIVERAADGTLKTNARLKEIYGGHFAYAAELVKEHWLFALIGLVGAIASIVALILFFTFEGSKISGG